MLGRLGGFHSVSDNRTNRVAAVRPVPLNSGAPLMGGCRWATSHILSLHCIAEWYSHEVGNRSLGLFPLKSSSHIKVILVPIPRQQPDIILRGQVTEVHDARDYNIRCTYVVRTAYTEEYLGIVQRSRNGSCPGISFLAEQG